MLMGIVAQNKSQHSGHTIQRTTYCCFHFLDTLSLERMEQIYKFIHFSDNGKKDEFQGPLKLFTIYPVI